MIIIVNGKDVETSKNSLEDIITELGLSGKVMAAAVNMNVVKQSEWSKFALSQNDKLELLDFVGGG